MMSDESMFQSLENAIDLERYAILDLDGTAGRQLVATCREQMDAVGACVLDGFVLPYVISEIVRELNPRFGDAYYCQHDHNPYLEPEDENFPPDHARNRCHVTDVGCLADDMIPDTSTLKSLYNWEPLQNFIATVLGMPKLHPYADPLGSLNVNIFQPGQQHAWHFDNADWVSTIMLQSAEAGGFYEYVPSVRSEDDQGYENITPILDGDRTGIRTLDMGPGALILFRGRYSIHRVSPIEGNRPRLVAVLSYDTEPGVMLSEYNRKLFYGRVA